MRCTYNTALPAGQTKLMVQMTLNSTAAAAGYHHATYVGYDTDPSDNSIVVGSPPVPSTRPSITMSFDYEREAEPGQPGRWLYTVSIKNNGPGGLTGAGFFVGLPQGWTWDLSVPIFVSSSLLCAGSGTGTPEGTLTSYNCHQNPQVPQLVAGHTAKLQAGIKPRPDATEEQLATSFGIATYWGPDSSPGDNVLVGFVNQTPVPNPISVAARGSTAISVSASDPDGDGLAYEVEQAPQHGTLQGTLPNVVYLPDPGYSGPDEFWFEVSDGLRRASAKVSIAVTNAPVATQDTYTVIHDRTLSIAAPGVLRNDSDADGDALSAQPITPPSQGQLALDPDGSFDYQPPAGFTGNLKFTYGASDGQSAAAATMSILVLQSCVLHGGDTDDDGQCDATDEDDDGDGQPDADDPCPLHADDPEPCPVNSPPVAADDAYTIVHDKVLTVAAPALLGNDSDPDGDGLIAVLHVPPVGGDGKVALQGNGGFVYTPDPGYVGTAPFEYRAFDGHALSDSATVTVTVVQDCSAHGGDLDDDGQCDATDEDIDGDGIPNTQDACPLDPDPACTANAAPVAQNDLYIVAHDRTLTLAAPGVLANDTDADADPLSAALTTSPTTGALEFQTDGSLAYTPVAGFIGTIEFAYAAHDADDASAPAGVSIMLVPDCAAHGGDFDGDGHCDATDEDIDGDGIPDTEDDCLLGPSSACTNTAPLAADDSYAIVAGTTLSTPVPGVLGNDTDADADELSAILTSAPAEGQLTLNADGSFAYVPTVGFQGSIDFAYEARDASASSNPATVSIAVVEDCAMHGGDIDHDGLCDNNDPETDFIDLAIAASNDRNDLLPGEQTLYVITAENLGTLAAHARIRDLLPANLESAAWVCSALGTTCAMPSGEGDIDAGVLMPPLSSLRFELLATASGEVGTSVINTATIEIEPEFRELEFDAATENNQSTDTDALLPYGMFRNGFEP